MDFLHGALFPVVKFSDDRDLRGGRGKGAEDHAALFRVRAQILVSVEYFSSVESVKIHNYLHNK